ncbi:hypothetical protein JW960_28000 [candidate division KSB1 bacterium]|nr:hypothetical protein [candidate division KSB1 bacterium]
MLRKLVSAIIFNNTCLAQFNIIIDAQKDTFYNHLISPDEGYIAISHNDYLPYNGPKPDNDVDLSAQLWMAWDSTYFYCYVEV